MFAESEAEGVRPLFRLVVGQSDRDGDVFDVCLLAWC